MNVRCGHGLWLIGVYLVVGCAKPRAAPPPGPFEPPISIVTSSVVIEACPDAKRMNRAQTAKEIEELVGPCIKVPGGAAHFSATLLPSGRVELASPMGDPSEGIVPTCLVQTVGQLKHRIRLTKPCKFDVKLEQRNTDPVKRPARKT